MAFTILGLALGVLLNIFARGTHIAGVSDQYAQATVLAESLLSETTGDLLVPGLRQGQWNDEFRWQVEVTPLTVPDAELVQQHNQLFPVQPLQLEVQVEWGRSDQARTVRLSTLRLISHSRARALAVPLPGIRR